MKIIASVWLDFLLGALNSDLILRNCSRIAPSKVSNLIFSNFLKPIRKISWHKHAEISSKSLLESKFIHFSTILRRKDSKQSENLFEKCLKKKQNSPILVSFGVILKCFWSKNTTTFSSKRYTAQLFLSSLNVLIPLTNRNPWNLYTNCMKNDKKRKLLFFQRSLLATSVSHFERLQHCKPLSLSKKWQKLHGKVGNLKFLEELWPKSFLKSNATFHFWTEKLLTYDFAPLKDFSMFISKYIWGFAVWIEY